MGLSARYSNPAMLHPPLLSHRDYVWAACCLLFAGLGYYLFDAYSDGGPFGWVGTLSARLTVPLLALFGIDTFSAGPRLISPTFSISVAPGCSPIPPLILYGAAVLAFPARLPSKLRGLLGGAVLLVGVNTVRLASLFVIGRSAPAYLDLMHGFIWQLLLVAATLALWLLWVRRYAHPTS